MICCICGIDKCSDVFVTEIAPEEYICLVAYDARQKRKTDFPEQVIGSADEVRDLLLALSQWGFRIPVDAIRELNEEVITGSQRHLEGAV